MSTEDLFGKSKYETALATLRFYCVSPNSGIGGYKRVLCAFSGGKDSQCCYHLLKDAGIPFVAQYSITRFEPPELMDFIRREYPDVRIRRAYKRSLVADIERNGLPTRFSRWCCEAKHTKTDGFDIDTSLITPIFAIGFEDNAPLNAEHPAEAPAAMQEPMKNLLENSMCFSFLVNVSRIPQDSLSTNFRRQVQSDPSERPDGEHADTVGLGLGKSVQRHTECTVGIGFGRV